MTESRALPPAAMDLVLLPLEGKDRPAVVLASVDEERVRVIHGTGTARDMPRVEVRPETREGKALRLYKPTYFYASNVRIARGAGLMRLERRCPPELFGRLRALADRGAG